MECRERGDLHREPDYRLYDGPGLDVLQAKDPYKGATIRLWDPNVRPANVQQWSLIIEQQLGQETVLSVGYVGSTAHTSSFPCPISNCNSSGRD